MATWSDDRVEGIMGNLLRIGVLTASVVVAIGGILYLRQNGTQPADHRVFHGEPNDMRSPIGVVRGALALESRAVIQFGLLLLIATPIARVIFSVFAFGRQKDWTYVSLTLIVLTILLYSLVADHP